MAKMAQRLPQPPARYLHPTTIPATTPKLQPSAATQKDPAKPSEPTHNPNACLPSQATADGQQRQQAAYSDQGDNSTSKSSRWRTNDNLRWWNRDTCDNRPRSNSLPANYRLCREMVADWHLSVEAVAEAEQPQGRARSKSVSHLSELYVLYKEALPAWADPANRRSADHFIQTVASIAPAAETVSAWQEGWLPQNAPPLPPTLVATT